MTQNKVMKLWTAIVTAFVALFTALGLITTTAAAAVPQTETARNSDSGCAPHATAPAMSPWSWTFARSLPPTMKQRIHAEAHGKSPHCRHRPLADADDSVPNDAAPHDSAESPDEPAAPLQR